jgi:predicted metal-binding membrane protein
MMFPTMTPMALMFARIAAGKQARQQPFVPTWVFVGAYLLVWAAAGVLAYGAAAGADALAERSIWLMDHAARIGGGILVLAGLYQLTPLKQACLAKCRSPLAFVLGSWRDGYSGALRMGVEHGVYCLGCCWLLFALLLPLGMMNIVAMALLTALVFAEKALPLGVAVSRAAALALIGYGVLVLIVPAALPTTL